MCINLRKLICHEIREAPRFPKRVRILREPIKIYLNRLAISKLEGNTSELRTTEWLQINKLIESNLVELGGSRRDFRATTRALTMRLNGKGIHLEETE